MSGVVVLALALHVADDGPEVGWTEGDSAGEPPWQAMGLRETAPVNS
ncbi:MAG: hypothetical protein H6726_12200 [Sandaracinaceae bacterium]|nr:hypothetical protein [Sandaracinaceae bacterium]